MAHGSDSRAPAGKLESGLLKRVFSLSNHDMQGIRVAIEVTCELSLLLSFAICTPHFDLVRWRESLVFKKMQHHWFSFHVCLPDDQCDLLYEFS